MARGDWLYGPVRPVFDGEEGQRRWAVDRDTVRDALTVFRKHHDDATFLLHGIEFDPAGLPSAPSADLRNLAIESRSAQQTLFLSQMQLMGSQSNQNAALAVLDLFRREGRPLFAVRERIPAVAGLPPVAVALAWAWYVLAERPPASLATLTALLTLASAVGLWLSARAAMRPHAYAAMRVNRIRTESRQEVYARRNDRKADLLLLAVSVPLSAALGAVATLILGQ